MAFMKRQTLIAILFVIATLFTSLHELMPHHSVTDCQVCTLYQDDHSLAPEDTTSLVTLYIPFSQPLYLHTQTTQQPYSTLNSRAPPSFS